MDNKLKTLLNNRNMTQKQLAELIHTTETAVQKWVVGKNNVPVSAAVDIATIIGCHIGEIIPELHNISITDTLFTIDDKAAKSIEYYGITEVDAGLAAYNDDYEMFLSTEKNTVRDDRLWNDKNRFLILLGTESEEVRAIRDFGQHSITGADFIFGDFIPIRFQGYGSDSCVQNYLHKARKIYESEIKRVSVTAKEEGKKPLILYARIDSNNYMAYSVTERKKIEVYDYKEYRADRFKYVKWVSETEYEIVPNKDYMVFTPDNDFINWFDLGWTLVPHIWEMRMPWDAWEPQPQRYLIENIPEKYEKTYKQSLHLINQNHKEELETDKLITELELRVNTFEKLIELGAPSIILENAAIVYQDALKKIPPLKFDF